MTIGWGTIGVIWERPVFVAYVRQQRYSREMLEECRVLYRQEQESDQFHDEITRQFYTVETGDHICCYYRENVSAYIIED